MKCLICQKEFKTITNTHLKKHDITPKEYKKMFGVKVVYDGFVSGERNPFFGRKHEKGSRVKSREYSENASKRMKGKTYEELYGGETAKKVKKIRSEAISDIKNPAYSNGAYVDGARGNINYPPEFNNTLKNCIRNRDDNRCFICKNEEGLRIHHIDYNPRNNDHFNLVTLCISCHMTTNYNRNYWQYFFHNLVHFKYGNQQPSLEGNFFEGSETNKKLLTDDAEENNFDTSALHPINRMMI